MAQWLVLRRHTRHSQVPLHIPLFTLVRAQILDTRRAALSDVQLDIFLVRSRALLPLAFSLSPLPLTGLAGKLFHLVLRVDERA
jgi:hypothetical protein